MANVLNRTTGLAFPYRKDYRTSVNDPDYPTANWIHNPDLSAVSTFDSIYWNISGDSVTLADQATRDSRDAEIAVAREQSEKDSEKARLDDTSTERVLRAIVKLLVDELNILRQQFNTTTAQTNQLTNTTFTNRTLAQARTAIQAEIDGGI